MYAKHYQEKQQVQAMCGIAGISAHPNDNLPLKTITANLLHNIEPRGRDATGYATWNPAEGKILHDKANIRARHFTSQPDLFIVTPTDRNIICHTRFATKGTPDSPTNNHPIAVNNNQIVGIHNGCLSNDDEIFTRLEAPRIDKVDSEAIFAALAYGTNTNPHHPNLGTGTIPAVLAEIEGSAAVAWFDTNDTTPDGTLHLARINASPLHTAQTPGGTFLFASTRDAIRDAVKGHTTLINETALPEGTYLRVNAGTITHHTTFTTASETAYVPIPTNHLLQPAAA